jgi:4-hydroxythreonine-4-phosphate dehydrogenase
MLPLIGVTIGDAAGVGPELLLRAASQLREQCVLVAYADIELLDRARVDLAARGVSVVERLRRVQTPTDARTIADHELAVFHVACEWSGTPESGYPWAHAIADFGKLQHSALLLAIEHAIEAQIDAISTLPWHKKRLADAGLPPTGHTEVLQQACGVEQVVMLLAGDVLRVALATVHIPVSQVAAHLNADDLLRTIRITHDTLAAWAWHSNDRPHIAVCGLNPHAGEEGTIGTEEQTLIAPVIERARALGMDVSGPWPADTVFPRVANGHMQADVVVAMYHDQGLGPLKTRHFGEAANLTLGLPIIRSSVDHGTAYDIAGRGVADMSSFLYATRLAAVLATRRQASGNAPPR